jgi:hypothetical protein
MTPVQPWLLILPPDSEWTDSQQSGKIFKQIKGTACLHKCKQLFEYQHLLLLRDIYLVVKVLILI